MVSVPYSFIDIAVLDDVRNGFAAGAALFIVSPDLGQIVWANGPGAALLGFSSIESVIGSTDGLSAAAKRQIGATSGFPDIGRDRAITVRLSGGFRSRIVNLQASAIVLPDGENALLFAVMPARSDTGMEHASAKAIGGFTAEGQFAAMIDARGEVVAASAGFERLGVTTETLHDLVDKIAQQSGRLIKKRIKGRKRPIARRSRPAD